MRNGTLMVPAAVSLPRSRKCASLRRRCLARCSPFRGRGGRHRQRHPLWAGGQGVDRRHVAGLRDDQPAAGRHSLGQHLPNDQLYVLFGGYKRSGIGRETCENGMEGIKSFQQTKAVWMNYPIPRSVNNRL